MAPLMEKDFLKVVATDDGSPTLFSSRFNQHYHSVYGAVDESSHIFLDLGFDTYVNNGMAGNFQEPLQILEVGLGTGLNCLLTLIAGKKKGISTIYSALEPYPVGPEIWKTLQYTMLDNLRGYNDQFASIHEATFETSEKLTPAFSLFKTRSTLETFRSADKIYHIIYFDAFSPEVQPELWTPAIFLKLYNMMKPGGFLLTYCVKGDVVRAMRAAGFSVEKHPGPPGKRHVVRAVK